MSYPVRKINIGIDQKDPSYRYKRDLLSTVVSGKYLVIINLPTICQQMVGKKSAVMFSR